MREEGIMQSLREEWEATLRLHLAIFTGGRANVHLRWVVIVDDVIVEDEIVKLAIVDHRCHTETCQYPSLGRECIRRIGSVGG